MHPSVCNWECHGQKAADTCFSQNLVDYYFGVILPVLWFLLIWWNYLRYMKSPNWQMWKSSSYSPTLQSPLSLGDLHSASWLWRRKESTCTCRTNPAGLRVCGEGSGCRDLRGDSQGTAALIVAKTPRSTPPSTGASAASTETGTAGTSSLP